MVAGASVNPGAFAAGVGVDHAAKCGAAARREVGREENPVGRKVVVELVQHHAGLHPHPAVLQIDFEDAVEVPGDIERDSGRERLPVGAGAAATSRDLDFLKTRFGGEFQHSLNVLGSARIHHGLRGDLIHAVVGGSDETGAEVVAQFSGKALGGERVQKVTAKRGGWLAVCESRNHLSGGSAVSPGTARGVFAGRRWWPP